MLRMCRRCCGDETESMLSHAVASWIYRSSSDRDERPRSQQQLRISMKTNTTTSFSSFRWNAPTGPLPVSTSSQFLWKRRKKEQINK
mmetsp:Transcript_177/g.238  ORF Transcript_177/g.238 Transcript_177/m.238 type:complete len:87 (-) Transcript_177:15-275(-)